MSNASHTSTFRGFDDYVEVFAAGTHVDSAGQEKTWTTADLDAIVANHTAPTPIVVGHPKTDSPAYGWTDGGLKRVDDRLFAKFTDVQPQFSAMVQKRHFPNRSIKVKQTATGPKLVHVGFLGAVPPAIEGLKPIEFAADADAPSTVYEFAQSQTYGWQLVASGMRRLREFFIEKFDLETADRLTPDYSIAGLEQLAADSARDDSSASGLSAGLAPSAFSAAPSSSTETAPVTISKADHDALQAKADALQAKLNEYAAADSLARAKTVIEAHVKAGRLLPAQAEGLAEFRAAIDQGQTFEFAAADGTKAPKPLLSQFDGLLASLPVQIESKAKGGADTAPGAIGNDPVAIASKASEFQAAEAKAGRTISIAEAVNHVSAAATA